VCIDQPLVILIGEHSVDRGAAYAERGCDRAGGFAAGVHTPGQLSLRLVKRLGSPDRLAACPTRFACRCTALPAKPQFKLGQAGEHAGGRSVENDPKSATSRRTLPLPERLVATLKAAKARQAAERLAHGVAYRSGAYVVSNEIGDPYSPAVLSQYWRDTLKAAGIRHIKLHAARHTCATLMHLEGVPVAVIAAWIGHKDASLTMRLYAHSQDDALKAAGATLDRVVTSCDIDTG
jgi:hypothetical protein